MVCAVFIIIPSETPHGPIKGAYTLANAIVESYPVQLVSLKRGPGAGAYLNPKVKKLCLAEFESSIINKLKLYKSLLVDHGDRKSVLSISMCFSADVINAMCRHQALTISSIRSNLVSNYKMDYGILGAPLAVVHLLGLRRFDKVVVMTNTMSKQIRFFSRKTPLIIGNFVDENALEKYRRSNQNTGKIKFIFVGSLSRRKQPWIILRALSMLQKNGLDASLDIIGEGPFKSYLESEIYRLNLNDKVRLHGFLNSPYDLISKSDVMVLPSLSEGISRAALEALYLGIPSVLRSVDANSQLILSGQNGELFIDELSLVNAMTRACQISRRKNLFLSSLIPKCFQQHYATKQYLDLIKSSE
jgi:glycosyltransferase involved in cell wall biosynthesis